MSSSSDPSHDDEIEDLEPSHLGTKAQLSE
jgi:hypothetical protein